MSAVRLRLVNAAGSSSLQGLAAIELSTPEVEGDITLDPHGRRFNLMTSVNRAKTATLVILARSTPSAICRSTVTPLCEREVRKASTRR